VSASQPLYELQQAETRLDAERADLHRIEQRLASSPEIDRSRASLGRVATQLAESRAALRRVEAKAEDAAAKVKKFTDTLYGGAIHDSREMASMESEISHARTLQSQLEDEEIELMEKIEALESEHTSEAAKLASLESQRAESLEPLAREQAAKVEVVTDLQRERDEAAARLTPAQLATYQRLRDRTGHAVSRVDDGICEWCRVQLPPKDIQHARGEALVTCTNCGRILFVEA